MRDLIQKCPTSSKNVRRQATNLQLLFIIVQLFILFIYFVVSIALLVVFIISTLSMFDVKNVYALDLSGTKINDISGFDVKNLYTLKLYCTKISKEMKLL